MASIQCGTRRLETRVHGPALQRLKPNGEVLSLPCAVQESLQDIDNSPNDRRGVFSPSSGTCQLLAMFNTLHLWGAFHAKGSQSSLHRTGILALTSAEKCGSQLHIVKLLRRGSEELHSQGRIAQDTGVNTPTLAERIVNGSVLQHI